MTEQARAGDRLAERQPAPEEPPRTADPPRPDSVELEPAPGEPAHDGVRPGEPAHDGVRPAEPAHDGVRPGEPAAGHDDGVRPAERAAGRDDVRRAEREEAEAKQEARQAAWQRAASRRPIVHAMQGHRAGFVSRFAACLVDVVVVGLIGVLLVVFTGIVQLMVHGFPYKLPSVPMPVVDVGYFVIAVGYLANAWVTHGRTFGDDLMGLRVLDEARHRLRPVRATVRAVLCVLFPWMLLWSIISRRNAGVHDLIVRSVVVYDWSYRAIDAR